MIIYTYTLYIYTLYTYTRFTLGFCPNATSPQGIPQGTSPFTCVVSPFCAIETLCCLPPFPSLPPSLPPEESWRALPILQYLYFSMLKPRYIINYINKHRSPVISRTNVTYSLGIFSFFFALCHDIENDKVRIIY